MRLLMLPLAIALLLAGSGCADECGALADQICQCKATLAERESCRVEVEAQQSNQPEPTADQLEACGAAAESCTCADLDENRTDKCGFTREAGGGGS